jgi:hypothetical protein
MKFHVCQEINALAYFARTPNPKSFIALAPGQKLLQLKFKKN